MIEFRHKSPGLEMRSEADRAGNPVLVIQGRLDNQSLATAWKPLTKWAEALDESGLRVDAGGVDYCDGTGVALFLELGRLRRNRGELAISGLSENYQRLLDQFDPDAPIALGRPAALPLAGAEEIGRSVSEFFSDIGQLVSFTGELFVAFVQAVRRPKRVRWGDVILIAETAGVNGLPIVALIGFLMGLIMSFQAAIPLRQFGADIFVADLIALSMLRELGPLMTAIILAGRTGSAFAAELGTMKVNEEIDALKTMGLPPVRFLVVTRVLGATLVTPLLTLFANVAGLVGGAVVLLSLGFPLSVYVRQALGAVDLVDLGGGLVKSVVFGVLVAGIGCLRGLQTKTGASAVGHSTTSAVVSGIILIALADGAFAVIFHFLEI
jgi:phospholipid/cholesterol/gamma-HCH transport system permease protein